MSKTRGKILVIRGGAIGDFILTLPVLAALRQQFPESHLEVLGYPHIASLAKAGGLADEVRSIEARAMATFFARDLDLNSRLADYFSKFALTVSYLYDPDEVFKDNVARCSSTQFIVGPHRPNEAERLHATEVFLKPLERLTIFDADTVPRLNLIATEDAALGQGEWLAMHPGSGSAGKNWPERKWAELLEKLAGATPLNFLLIGGEAEGERLAGMAAAVPQGRVKLAQNLPLPELARWLKHCTAFIGHDSGISHLAAAMGLPGLVLWSYTNEVIWRPKGEQIHIVREPRGLASLPVNQVLAQVTGMLKTI